MENLCKVVNTECYCIQEPVDDDMLKAFFTFYPNRIAFVKDGDEKVTGIISYADFLRGKGVINRNFKKIFLHKDYLLEVNRFFDKTKYNSIPVFDEKGRLVECYYRNRLDAEPGYKWLDISNIQLARLMEAKGYRKIKVCMLGALSEKIYTYFKYYESYFDTVEKISWNDALETKDDEVLIVNEETKTYLTIPLYSFCRLQIELEYALLLNRCKAKGIKLYVVSIPTSYNIWNITEEEKERVNARIYGDKKWSHYLENREQYAELLQQVLSIGEDKKEFIDECLNISSVIRKNHLYYMQDIAGKHFNVINGNRVTKGVPEKIKNHIYLSGNSFVYGPLVDDENTIASLLQEKINQFFGDVVYEVVNEGICGIGIYESIKRLNQDPLKEGDMIILFIDEKIEKEILEQIKIKIYHLEDIFNTLDRSRIKSYFLESPTHLNAFGYQLCADYLLKMFQEDYDNSWKEKCIIDDTFIYEKNVYEDGLDKELENYLEEFKGMYRKGKEGGCNGAIVMNCNPLTYGHKYLIEYAASQVECLYIFVVQEDKSEIPFEERFEMVRACTAQNPNIVVLPSGQYVISAFTFPDYFTKEMFKPEMTLDTSKDVIIFGKYIAPALNIKVRFAGEEPTDIVTAQYNDSMGRILPQYGIQFVEIPRLEKRGIGIISAKKVREAIKNGDWEQVKELVPETTYRILKKREIKIQS